MSVVSLSTQGRTSPQYLPTRSSSLVVVCKIETVIADLNAGNSTVGFSQQSVSVMSESPYFSIPFLHSLEHLLADSTILSIFQVFISFRFQLSWYRIIFSADVLSSLIPVARARAKAKAKAKNALLCLIQEIC
jgi:hypothetical protein